MKAPIQSILLALACTFTCTGQSRGGDPVAADDKVKIHAGTSNGFIHPGIGMTREILENARAQVIARRDPWYSGFKSLAADPYSAKSVTCRNESGKIPGMPDADAFDNKGVESRLKQDGAKAKQQALMYIFTGDEVFRANAMRIIRVWSRMNPHKYKNYREAHIHASYPVQDLILAAELMRHTSTRDPKLAWKMDDTRDFTTNFVVPAVNTFLNQNGWFMNQNGYPLAAAMAADIFTNNSKDYAKRVEWFTVNRSAPNSGWSSSVTHLARLVDTNALTGEKMAKPVVQLMEMGRDQAHAGDDAEIFTNTARQMIAQRTLVDPVTGTISVAPGAVGPYEFLDNRILAAVDNFCRFMLGHDTPWIPAPYDIGPGGEIRGIYPRIADNYRGRIRGLDIWDMYYYYTYRKGVDVAAMAPYYHEAFCKRIVRSVTDWIYIPAQATGEAARVAPTVQEPDVVGIGQRCTLFDKNSTISTKDGMAIVRLAPGDTGSRLAILSCATDAKTIGMRVCTTGPAEITMSGFASPWLLPDTHGEWRNVSYTMAGLERFIDIVYFNVKAAASVRVDLDRFYRKAGIQIATPTFASGNAMPRLITYAGAPIRIDFSAKSPSGIVRIQGLDLPEGALLDENTGEFRWQPVAPGTHDFVVQATAGDAIVAKQVRLVIAPDRAAAVSTIASAIVPDVRYSSASLRRCSEAIDLILATRTQDDNGFLGPLLSLQQAFEGLEPLTPCLADGSMDFPSMVANSNIGESIGLLTDGNNDTFPGYFLAKDLKYTLDFGPGYRVCPTGFALQGRLNFETRTSDTAIFGSNDNKAWTQLTDPIPGSPTALTRLALKPEHMGTAYRFLKIEKTSRRTGGLFEPSELRIHGHRIEGK